jgi:DNA-binding NarL/FixJ family response regulator
LPEDPHPPVTVLVADDHPVFRAIVRRAIDGDPGLSVVAEAADGHEAMRLIAALSPAIAVVDRHMPGLSGDEIVDGVVRAGLPTRLLLFTADPPDAAPSPSFPARYLRKGADSRELRDAIAAVARDARSARNGTGSAAAPPAGDRTP